MHEGHHDILADLDDLDKLFGKSKKQQDGHIHGGESGLPQGKTGTQEPKSDHTQDTE